MTRLLDTRMARFALAFVVPVSVLSLWTWTASRNPSLYWPSPVDIAGQFPETWLQGRIREDVVPSILRLAAGYGLALGIGIPAGMLIGTSRRLRLFVEPVRDLLRAIPPTVLVPVVMIFAGIDDGSKVIVIFWGCFWSIVLNSTEGVRGVDEVHVDTSRAYRVHRARFVARVLLPSAAPQIVVGARQALSIGIIMTVISEMFAASNGIGFNIIQFQRSFAITEMWTGMVVLGALGVTLNFAFRFVERRFILRWYHGMQGVTN